MEYTQFRIQNYRAIQDLTLSLEKRIIPLVGVNECGKTTILQALESFDEANDDINEGKHLKSTENLYVTKGSNPPIITASIKMSENDIEQLINYFKGTIENEALTLIYSILKKWRNQFTIRRELTASTQKHGIYQSEYFDELEESQKGLISRCIPMIYQEIVCRCPHVLYNDDFNDRPPKSIKIDTGKRDDWARILERVFKSHEEHYDINAFFNIDPRRKKSILSDINKYLSEILTKEWSKYAPDKKQSIEIEIEESPAAANTFDITIKETTSAGERFFSIEDRSKGFIWNYNFIMKTLFSPKESESKGNTIFLLDEPGSYLHSSAQTTLCKKIKEISESEGIVIYCTHTPQLLDPKYIPINNIHIVEKDSQAGIVASKFCDAQTTRTKRTHMQPVYDALQIPEYKPVSEGTTMICVEGINDKYCLELLGGLPENFRILPGANAESILNNIQYMIAYNIPYIAIWDNDNEGKKYHKKASDIFGGIETQRFIMLPDSPDGKRRMEEMIAPEDYAFMRERLQLPEDAQYSKILYSLIQHNANTKRNIVDTISEKTKQNFLRLKRQIEQALQQN